MHFLYVIPFFIISFTGGYNSNGDNHSTTSSTDTDSTLSLPTTDQNRESSAAFGSGGGEDPDRPDRRLSRSSGHYTEFDGEIDNTFKSKLKKQKSDLKNQLHSITSPYDCLFLIQRPTYVLNDDQLLNLSRYLQVMNTLSRIPGYSDVDVDANLRGYEFTSFRNHFLNHQSIILRNLLHIFFEYLLDHRLDGNEITDLQMEAYRLVIKWLWPYLISYNFNFINDYGIYSLRDDIISFSSAYNRTDFRGEADLAGILEAIMRRLASIFSWF